MGICNFNFPITIEELGSYFSIDSCDAQTVHIGPVEFQVVLENEDESLFGNNIKRAIGVLKNLCRGK